jgi:hypothetical protein
MPPIKSPHHLALRPICTVSFDLHPLQPVRIEGRGADPAQRSAAGDRVALQIALRLAAGEIVDSHQVELATELVVRNSTAPPST